MNKKGKKRKDIKG